MAIPRIRRSPAGPVTALAVVPAVVVLAVLAAPRTAVAEVDPFYRQLADRGRLEAQQGLHAEAARHLRLACFGMLDVPRELAACLVSLAVAQGEAGDRTGFGETFTRLIELERRFSALSQTELAADERQRFEARAAEWIDYDVLAAVPFLRQAARRRVEQTIAALPRDEQRRELERRIAAEPAELGWRVLAAELALAEGDAGHALADLDAVLGESPELGRALCLRAVARAELGRCGEAMADLPACGDEVRPAWQRPLLACAVEVGDWPRAQALLDRVPPAERRRGPYRGWEERIAAGLAETAAEPAVPAPPPATTAVPPPPPPVDVADVADVAELNQLLAAATSRGQLEAVAARALPLADAQPASRELQHLAGEVAYRLADWPRATAYLERGLPLPAERPELGFYYAVALYETGRREAAASALEAVLPRMRRTPFVESYAEKILVGAGS